MPSPLPGQEAVDLGNGLASTTYDDGSVEYWRIDTGELVQRFGPPSGRPFVGPDVVDFSGAIPSFLYDPSTGFVQPGVLPDLSPAQQATALGQNPRLPQGPPGAFNPLPGAVNPLLQGGQPQGSRSSAVTPPPGGATNGWVYDLVLENNRWVPVRRHPRLGIGNQPIPSGDTSPEATFARSQADAPQQFGSAFATTGPAFFLRAGAPNQPDAVAQAFLRSDTPASISTGIENYSDQAKRGLLAGLQSGDIRVGSQQGTQIAQQLAQQLGVALPPAALTPQGGPGGAPGQVGAGFGAGEFVNLEAQRVANEAATVAYQRAFTEWQQRHGDAELAQRAAEAAALDAFRNAELAFRQSAQQQTFQLGQQQNAIATGQLLGSLRGPANAFQYANVLSGLNQAGQSNVLDALRGLTTPPAFQAPQGLTEAATLDTLVRDLRNAGATQAQAQQFAAGLPAPNQLVSTNFLQLPESTQQLILAGFESQGFDPGDVLNTIRATLPQFRAPAAGALAA